MEIRDSKLYRIEGDGVTFESYCRDKWKFTDNFARRMIRGAEVAANLKSVPIGTVPQTESQARPLTKLDPVKQVEAWGKQCPHDARHSLFISGQG